MDRKTKDPSARKKREKGKAYDTVSAVMLALLPAASGLIFFRLLVMCGSPVWVTVGMGVIFAGCLLQAGCYFATALIRARRRRQDREGR